MNVVLTSVTPPLQTSFTFNEVAGFHVHNQQEFKLPTGHEFVDIAGYQWSLLDMVLHVEFSREVGHFVAYVWVAERWWLCDDDIVKKGAPPIDPRKATFLLYKWTHTDMDMPDQS